MSVRFNNTQLIFSRWWASPFTYAVAKSFPDNSSDWQPQLSWELAARTEMKNPLHVLLTFKVIQMQCMSAFWTRCSGILNWSSFCTLVSDGWQYLSLDKKINTNTLCRYWLLIHIPSWQRSDQLYFCCSLCCCVCVCVYDRPRKKPLTLCRCLSIRQKCLRAWGLQLGHILVPALHTWMKVIPPGLRWAQISVYQKCNWRNLKIHPSW